MSLHNELIREFPQHDVDKLHWVIRKEPIALNQLKERYYDPGLLAKVTGFSEERLRPVGAFHSPRGRPRRSPRPRRRSANFR